jgi:hypothetical protein
MYELNETRKLFSLELSDCDAAICVRLGELTAALAMIVAAAPRV